MSTFREYITEVTVSSSIAIKGLSGKVKEMIEFIEKQKGWSHSAMFEKGSEFELFFETSRQSRKVVRLTEDKYGYFTKEIGNNGRIVEITLNDAGLSEKEKVDNNGKPLTTKEKKEGLGICDCGNKEKLNRRGECKQCSSFD